MKRMMMIPLVATALFALSVGPADARRPSKGGTSVQTNYGCATLAAGTTVRSADGLVQKRLLIATPACYICNLSTRVCTIQSPTSLVGWTFVY